MVIEFTETIGPIEQEMVAMFNDLHISEESVREYINTNGSNMGYNEWIVFMTKEQYENLKDNDFYEDLRLEQQEQM
jgi:hypothetical protein